jgi:T5SS/PEP-CTERM-associated repeat protein
MAKTYQWTGGDGAFSDGDMWQDPTAPPPGTGTAPGPGDVADFSSGGAISGSGDVDQLQISATVTLTGSVSASDPDGGVLLYSSGMLTVTGQMTISDLKSADGSSFSVDGGTITVTSGNNNPPDYGVVGMSVAGTTDFSGASISSVGWIGIGNSDNGLGGGIGQLTARNGSSVEASYTGLGGAGFFPSTVDDQGILVVSGAGTKWHNDGPGRGYLAVGIAGFGTVTINGGAVLQDDQGASFGDSYSSSLGSLTVTDTGSQWLNAGFISVGDVGRGIVAVINGAQATANGIDVGTSASARGTLTVDGSGSSLDNSGFLTVGFLGEGTVTVSGGGQLTDTSGEVAQSGAASIGSVTVTDAGSTWQNSQFVDIGNEGQGVVTIEAGASAASDVLTLGRNATGSGTLTVDGVGSEWNDSGFLDIGDVGEGWLTIEAGGLVIAEGITVGDTVAASGTVDVTGNGSHLDGSGHYFIAGFSGDGDVTLENGATLDSADSYIGWQQGATGTVTVDDAIWTATQGIIVGLSGIGQLDIQNGSDVESLQGIVGDLATGDGTVTVDGAASAWDITQDATFGAAGTADVTVSDSGEISSVNGTLGASDTGFGDVTITGAGSDWDLTGSLIVADAGDADLRIEGGGTVTADSMVIGAQPSAGLAAGADAVVTGAGATLTVSNDITIGDQGVGELFIEDSGAASTGAADIGESGLGNGFAIVDTNGAWTINGDLIVGDGAFGQVQLTKGGSLTIKGASLIIGSQADGDGLISLNGSGSAIDYSGPITVGDFGTGTLSLGGGATYTVAGDLDVGVQDLSDGKVLLTDAGTELTVNGTLTIGDAGDGTLDISGGASLVAQGDLIEGAQDTSTGTDLISDDKATVNIQGAWTIGAEGAHSVTLSAAAIVSVDGNLTLGEGAAASGTLAEDGAGTTVTIGGGSATIGDAGAGTLTLTGGATFDGSADNISLADQSGSSASVTVSGESTELDASTLTVGGDGSAELRISEGGAVTDTNDLTVGEGASGSGSVTIDGSGGGASLSAGGISVGAEGQGTIDVSGADASLSGDDITVGESSGATGMLTVESGSVDASGDLKVGGQGSGTLAVTLTGTVTASKVTVGDEAGGDGSVSLDGAGTRLIANDVTVGSGGQGDLSITNGATLQGAGGLTLGDLANGLEQTATVDTGALAILVSDLTVGGEGDGDLTLRGGGTVSTSGNVAVGDQPDAIGSITVSGAATTLGWGGTLEIGNAGTGTVTVLSGTVAVNTGGVGDIAVGASSGGVGSLDVEAGGTLQGVDLGVGGDGDTEGGSGEVTLAGEVSVSDTAQVFLQGTVNLDGGDLQALGARKSTPAA